MADRAHAILSASGSHKWLRCPPSARLEEAVVEEVRIDYKDRGDLGHSLVKLLIHAWLDFGGLPPDHEYATLQASKLWDQKLQDEAEICLEFIKRQWAKAQALDPSAQLLVEKHADFREWVPDGFGTADVTIVYADVLLVIDWKFGEGVVVAALDNSQARLYALGRLRGYEGFWQIKRVITAIVQPSRDRESFEELTVEALLAWGDETVRPNAKLAWAGQGAFNPGDWCQFCKIKDTCAARIKSGLAIIDEVNDGPAGHQPPTLTNAELAELLLSGRLERAASIIKSLFKVGFTKLQAGEDMPGLKLVEGRGKRDYTDQYAASQAIIKGGTPDAMIWKPRVLLGITDMTKLMGKKVFKAVLEDTKLVVKKPGGAKMAPEADNRPPLDKVAAAAAKFADAGDIDD